MVLDGGAARMHRPTEQSSREQRLGATLDAHGSVPTRELRNTQCVAPGALVVYQLALVARFESGLHLRAGLKAFLKGA